MAEPKISRVTITDDVRQTLKDVLNTVKRRNTKGQRDLTKSTVGVDEVIMEFSLRDGG